MEDLFIDHNTIRFSIADTPASCVSKSARFSSAWDVNMDLDMFIALMIGNLWCPMPCTDAQKTCDWVDKTFKRTLNNSTDRRSREATRITYWWNKTIFAHRKEYMNLRRKLKRARRKNNIVQIQEFHVSLKNSRRALRTEITKAKSKGWKKLISLIDDDTSGFIYKLMLGKLIPAIAPITESLPREALNEIVTELFPNSDVVKTQLLLLDWRENFSIYLDELVVAVKRIKSEDEAPDSDGVVHSTIVKSFEILAVKWLVTFNRCEEKFPKIQKTIKLALLEKPEKKRLPSSDDPTCLLDEGGKLERIIVNHFYDYLEWSNKLSETVQDGQIHH